MGRLRKGYKKWITKALYEDFYINEYIPYLEWLEENGKVIKKI